MSYWTTFKGSDVFRTTDGSAYFFLTRHVAIDADGAPNSYHPDDIGLDVLANAGYPDTSWWSDVLVVDPADPKRPLVRTDGPFKGYFISKTALSAAGLADTDPRKYVDATAVPYVVLPTDWYPIPGSGAVGDLAAAKSVSGLYSSAAIVADVGGGHTAQLGEISVRLAELLGAGVASPRTGPSNDMGELMYAIFPRSRQTPRWPVSAARMALLVDALLVKAGGWPAPSCMKKP